MNVRRDGKCEGPHGDGHGGVRRCYKRRITQAKVFVTYMNRECDGGEQEGQQSPCNTHLIGRRPTRERAECDADDKVHHTYEYHRSEPPLTTRCIHVFGPTPEFVTRPARAAFNII